jgi:stage III sporulation protein AB
LRLAAVQLKAEEDAARDDQAKYEKMSRSLGLLLAALVVILMV